MAVEDDIRFLDRIPTFHVLGREALRIIAISAEALRVSSGDCLFEEGEPADGGYVVVDGAVVLQSTLDHPNDAPNVAGPGSLIGEMALMVETRRPATATAIKPSTIWKIPRTIFVRVLEDDPRSAELLRRMIARRVGRLLQELDTVVPMFKDEET